MVAKAAKVTQVAGGVAELGEGVELVREVAQREAIAVSCDGRLVLSRVGRTRLALDEVATGAPRWEFDAGEYTAQAAFSRDGALIAATEQGPGAAFVLYDAVTHGRVARHEKLPGVDLYGARDVFFAWSSDGRRVAWTERMHRAPSINVLGRGGELERSVALPAELAGMATSGPTTVLGVMAGPRCRVVEVDLATGAVRDVAEIAGYAAAVAVGARGALIVRGDGEMMLGAAGAGAAGRWPSQGEFDALRKAGVGALLSRMETRLAAAKSAEAKQRFEWGVREQRKRARGAPDETPAGWTRWGAGVVGGSNDRRPPLLLDADRVLVAGQQDAVLLRLGAEGEGPRESVVLSTNPKLGMRGDLAIVGGAGDYVVVNVRDGMKNLVWWLVLRLGAQGEGAKGEAVKSAGAKKNAGAAVKKAPAKKK